MSILVRHFFSGTMRASKVNRHFYEWVAHPQCQWNVIGLWRRPHWWPWRRSRCCQGWPRTSRSERTSVDRGTFPSEAICTDLWSSPHTRTFQFGTWCGWGGKSCQIIILGHSHLQFSNFPIFKLSSLVVLTSNLQGFRALPSVASDQPSSLWSSETWSQCSLSIPGRERGPQAQSGQFSHHGRVGWNTSPWKLFAV